MGWKKPIDRVFILSTPGPSGSMATAKELQDQLAALLNARGVATQAWTSNILDLADPDKLKVELAAFKPHYLLRITQTSTTYTNGSQSAATFDLTLTEPGAEAPIWRARTRMGSSWAEDPAAALARGILNALRQDGILPS
jgi:hypothetical protein